MRSKKLVYCTADAGDNGGIFNYSFTWLQVSASVLGIEVIKLNLSKPRDLRKLLVCIGDDQYCIYSNIWLYDLQIQGFGLSNCDADPVDEQLSRLNITALIADHPFSTYMYGRVSKASPIFRYIFLDESYKDVAAHIRGSPLDGEKLLGVVTPNYEPHELPQYRDRVIDILAPMAIHYPKIQKIWEDISDQHLRNLFEYVWNTYSYTHEKTAYQYWLECSETMFGSETSLRTANETFRMVLVNFLSDLDVLTRTRFREQTISFIAETFPDKTLYITDSPSPVLSGYKNIQFLGRVGFEKCVQLIANSKRVLHCQPTYFNSFHERPIISQALGSLVITAAGQWTDNLLPNSFVAFEPNENCEVLCRAIDSVIWPDTIDQVSAKKVSYTYGTEKFLKQLLGLDLG